MMKKLMEKCRMIRENQKKNGTKGFSMVELIIVIAIMAILIALIGTQLIPYLEKSRENKDLNTLDSAKTALQSVIVDYEIKASDFGTNARTIADLDNVKTGATASFEKYAGFTSGEANSKFASEAADGGDLEFTLVDKSGTQVIIVTKGDLWVTSNGFSGNDGTPRTS